MRREMFVYFETSLLFYQHNCVSIKRLGKSCRHCAAVRVDVHTCNSPGELSCWFRDRVLQRIKMTIMHIPAVKLLKHMYACSVKYALRNEDNFGYVLVTKTSFRKYLRWESV